MPFVSKAIGRPIAQLAARVMAGKSLAELGFTSEVVPAHVSVKEAVFPFVKFPGVDTLLGPEMKSTGEVMGIDREFGRAYAKAQRGAGMDLPTRGTVLVVAARRGQGRGRGRAARAAGRGLQAGRDRRARPPTCASAGSTCETIHKVREGSPHTGTPDRARAR